jgi:hypothetical protein
MSNGGQAMSTLYFGYHIRTLDSALEEELLDAIADEFPGYDIENPKDHTEH